MPKTVKVDTSQTQTIKKMLAEGATVGTIARRLRLPLEETRCLVLGNDYREKLQAYPSGKPLPAKQSEQSLTPEDFIEWLQKEVVPRLERMPVWPKGATRFRYFSSEASWNVRIDFDMEQFESAYKEAHEAGDKVAIFEFAKDDRECLKRKWVIEQLVAWRLSSGGEGKRSFETFMRAYWSQQGTRNSLTTLEIIKRDQSVYKDSLSRTNGPRIAGLAKEHTMSKDNVKDVLKHYRAAFRQWKSSPFRRLLKSGLISPLTFPTRS